VRWKEETFQDHPEGNNNGMDDHGEISVPEGDVWLQVRVDGKKVAAPMRKTLCRLGMIFEQ